jgi:putative zinc finger protein
MHARHISDEELLLDYYGEATPEQRAEMRAHLGTCVDCQALDRELRGVLVLVDNEPLTEAPPGFEREMWARLEPVVSGFSRTNVVSGFSRTKEVRLKADTTWSFELPRWALAASVAALAVGSFALGRVWDTPTTSPRITTTDMRELSERMLRSEVEEHLERSQRVFVELVNADDSSPVLLASDRERAADLVAAGRLYRRSVEDMGDADTRDLLEDVQRVLVEIANGPEVESSNDLSDVRARITDQDLIFRLRVMTAEMQARERRARPTW